ncbi:MAG TPA: RNA polymerase sigma-70 factor [Gemmatimonadales bacterium]|nr:RNA polymerase sigma-70 factor [Gemmatimonadales bacterium]
MLPRRRQEFTHTLSAPDAVERECVARIRLGDEGAFESLFHAYYARLCDFAQSYVRSPDVAEELVQTVFLRIWEHRATWEPITGARAYLFAACRNQALGLLKHQRVVARVARRATREGIPLGIAAARVGPDDALQASELARVLRDAVDKLPERRRLVVILRWQQQMSHAEIARVLGISVKTVEVQMGRAFAFFRRQLAHLRR